MSGSQSQALSSQGVGIVGRFTLTVSSTATAGTGTGTFVRAAGSWITDGIAVGMRLRTTHVGNSTLDYTVTNLTATIMTVAEVVAAVASAVSATFTVSVPLGEVTDFGGPGGTSAEIDITHLGSTSREFRAGLRESGEVTLDLNFVPGNVGQVWLRRQQAQTNQAARQFVLTLSDAVPTTATFNAFVREFSINGSVDEKISASVTLRITGDVAWSDVT